MIFLSPALDVMRMSMSTVSFFAQLDSGIHCLQDALIYDLNGLKSRDNRHLFSLEQLSYILFILSSLVVVVVVVLVLVLVLVVTIQLCMEGIPIKKYSISMIRCFWLVWVKFLIETCAIVCARFGTHAKHSVFA